MNRIPFDLHSVRLARRLKAAVQAPQAFEPMPHHVARRALIARTYAAVPDAVLARLERLLVEREQLKQMISSLLQRVA